MCCFKVQHSSFYSGLFSISSQIFSHYHCAFFLLCMFLSYQSLFYCPYILNLKLKLHCRQRQQAGGEYPGLVFSNLVSPTLPKWFHLLQLLHRIALCGWLYKYVFLVHSSFLSFSPIVFCTLRRLISCMSYRHFRFNKFKNKALSLPTWVSSSSFFILYF